MVWMNEIGERVADFPGFLELTLEMLTAEIAERRHAPRSTMRPSMPAVDSMLGFVAA